MRVIMIMVLLLSALTGCGSNSSGDDQAPVAQVRAFADATQARDVDAMVALLTPETRRDARWQLEQALSSVQSLEYTNPTFLLSENDGSVAYVQVSGSVTALTTDNDSRDLPVHQLVELHKVDGTWLIAGNGLAGPLNP